MLDALVNLLKNNTYAGVILIIFTVPVFLYLLFNLKFFKRVLKKKNYRTTDLSVLQRVPEITIPFEELSLIWTVRHDVKEEKKSIPVPVKVEEPPKTEKKERVVVSGDKTVVLPMLQHEPLKKLWNEVVTPYIEEYKLQNFLPLVVEGFVLLDKHFNVSSLSGVEEDPETVQITDYKDVIAKVTLGEHTINVVKRVVDEAKKVYYSPEAHIPKLVAAALFHDIGKVREYQQKYTGNRSHSFTSANILLSVVQNLYKNDIPAWVEDVAQAVREHHIPTKNEIASILKRADTRSRALEVALHVGNLELKDVEQWFDLNEFKKDLFTLLNVDQAQPVVGFTFGNCVYVRKQGLIHLVDLQRRRKNVLSHEFLYNEGLEEVKNKVTKILISQGWTVSDKGWHKKTIYYRGKPPYEFYLLVLKGSIFTPEELQELETRRQGSIYAGITQVQ